MLIDTHSHINADELADDLPEILCDLYSGEVGRVICPSFSFESSITSLGLATGNQRVFCALGVHPDNCLECTPQFFQFLRKNLANPKVVAVGEIGLDYHTTRENRAAQFDALNRQIDIAAEFDLPVIFHIRDAFDDFFEWLETNRSRFGRGVVHCFEGDAEVAKKVLGFDLMISITGLVTFPPRADIRAAVASVPLEKIMVETDAPYLAPVPHRGERNRPEYVELVARKIAEIKGVSLQTVSTVTTQNAYQFFEKMRVFDEKRN